MDAQHRGVGPRGLRQAPHPAASVGVPAIAAGGDLALLQDVDQRPREERQRSNRLGPRGGTCRLVGAGVDGLRGAVVGQSFQSEGVSRTVASEPKRKGPIILRDPDGGGPALLPEIRRTIGRAVCSSKGEALGRTEWRTPDSTRGPRPPYREVPLAKTLVRDRPSRRLTMARWEAQ